MSEKKKRSVDVAIIGAGSAGLSARREVEEVTENYVVIDDGPLGTTCARVGCMPSKVIIQVAEDFHRRAKFAEQGIQGAEGLSLDAAQVMTHVRKLRDRFTRGVFRGMESWSDKLIRERARFVEKNVLEVGDELIEAKSIIVATGSSPIIPAAWKPYQHRLIDTDMFFEQETLPKRVAVIGLGVIGLELGQALARLGVDVTGITLDKAYGHISDPQLQDYMHEVVREEMKVHLSPVEALDENDDGLVVTLKDGTSVTVDAALVTMGRRPNIGDLGLREVLGLGEREMPEFSTNTFRIKDTPIYFAGDVNGSRPLLHEAADEGRIAGHNAVREEDDCFRRRTPLTVAFSSPIIGLVGESHRALVEREEDFVIGEVSYEGQGRAIVKLKERGLLRVYVQRQSGRILGAELAAPNGDHLAHLLAWTIAGGISVHEALQMPFYHPVLEEGLRTALRGAVKQCTHENAPKEVMRCQDPPAGTMLREQN